MKRTLSLCILVVLLVLSCGKKVMVPPRIDLTEHEILGIIEFKCSNEGELGALATKKFMEVSRVDQGLVKIKELGTEKEILKAVGQRKLNQDAYKAIGLKYGVSTIITGELDVSNIRPDVTISPGFGYMGFGAEVDASLTAQMVEVVDGASIWSGSAKSTESVGHVSIFGGKAFAFDADDPDKAYGKLIDNLVDETTIDFRITWRRE